MFYIYYAIQFIIVGAGVYLWLFIKSLFTGSMRAGTFDWIISGLFFYWLSMKLIKWLINRK